MKFETATAQVRQVEFNFVGYALIFAYVVGINLEVKGLLPASIGPTVESALRWLPGLSLGLAMLILHRAWSGVLASPVFAVFLIAILQSCLLSVDRSRSLIEFFRDAGVFLTIFAILAGEVDEERFWRTLGFAASAFCLASVLIIPVTPELAWMNYQWGPSQWRLQGVAPQAVTFGFIAGISVLVNAFMTLRGGPSSPAFAAMTLLNLGAFIAAGSRGPWLGVLVGGGLFITLRAAEGSGLLRAALFAFAGTLLPLAIAGIYIYSHVVPVAEVIEFAESSDSKRMMTLVERALIWNVGRTDIAAAPFTGIGYAVDVQVDHYMSDEDGQYPHVHSFFMEYWRSSGIFAMITLAIMIFGTYWINLVLAITGDLRSFACLRLVVAAYVLGCALFDAPFKAGIVMLAGLAAFAFTMRRI